MERSAELAWAGQLFRSARTRLGWDLRWAADVLGVSRGYLLEVEMGLLAPTVGLCRHVAKTLNLSAEDAAELLAAVNAIPAVQGVQAWVEA